MALSRRKCLKVIIFLSICGSLLMGMRLLGRAQNPSPISSLGQNYPSRNKNGFRQIQMNPHVILPAFINNLIPKAKVTSLVNSTTPRQSLEVDLRKSSDKKSMEVKTKFPAELHKSFETPKNEMPSYQVHAFYYPWYGSPEHDSQYFHWNHPYIRHWNKNVAKQWPNYTHKPPDDVGSNYYPLLGAYSSKDPEVIDMHMKMMRYAKVGVVVVSWYPPGDADNEGREPDAIMPLILDAADRYELKVAVHVEPFKGRDAISMRQNLKYIIETYSHHSAFYRTSFHNKRNLPLIYIYDSYLVEGREWAKIFRQEGSDTVRGTELDGIFIGLLVEVGHKDHLLSSGFDGFYTYFATNKFTYGSTWNLWPELKRFSNKKGMMFIPSVGPGYIDTEVRPWNSDNTRKRLDGKYYDESFTNALKMKPDIVSITSFNEWHEGTQIEPAVMKTIQSRKYLDYGVKGPNYYLDLTRQWVNKMDDI